MENFDMEDFVYVNSDKKATFEEDQKYVRLADELVEYIRKEHGVDLKVEKYEPMVIWGTDGVDDYKVIVDPCFRPWHKELIVVYLVIISDDHYPLPIWHGSYYSQVYKELCDEDGNI